jgi:hypothetical protein
VIRESIWGYDSQIPQRIAELVKRKQKQRLAKQAQLAKKEAAGDFSHLKGRGGAQAALPQPTLPTISLEDDEDDLKTVAHSRYAGSVRTGKESYWSDRKDGDYAGGAYMPDYPPMPAFDPNAYPPQPGYAPYAASLHDDGSTLYGEHDDYSAKVPIRGNTPANQDVSSSTFGSAAISDNTLTIQPYANTAYGYDQYQERHTPAPDPYGQDPYGRNYAQGGYDTNAAYAQEAYDADAYGGTYPARQGQQTHYDAYYDANGAQYSSQHPQQPPRQMPSRNGTKWDGGQAY